MAKRIMLILFIIGSFYGYYGLFFDTEPEFLSYVLVLVLMGFQILGSIWVYKDAIGWDKFEYSEGFNIKRKKGN